MTQKLVTIDDGDGNRFPLLYVDQYGVALKITDPAGDWEQDCCCDCESFPYCLACLDEHTYTSSQTVDWPEDVTSCTIECWGRGGQGGDSNTAGEAAGGGGGGAAARRLVVSKSADSLDVIVNDATNDYASEVKQDSTTECKAAAGENGEDGPNGLGGQGGQSGIGDFIKTGGNGADGVNNDRAGGGGGGAGTLVSGQDAAGAEGGKGGFRKGGDGGDADGSKNGENYGGGGAGGYSAAAGGNGGQGLVRILWRYPMKLNLTIGGAPSAERQDCCEPDNAYYKKRLLWSNLNRTFTLEQSTAGDTTFCWLAVDDCSDHEALAEDAVLVETFDHGTEFGCDGPFRQQELYVYGICATVTCDPMDGKMKLAGVSFSCASCARSMVGPPPFQWGEWGCGCSPPTCPDFLCPPDGPDLQTAVPCTKQTMIKRIYWPTIEDVECALDVTCDDTSDGTLTAKLSC